MSSFLSATANAQSILHSLAGTTAVTMTDVFPAGNPVNVVDVASDVDTYISFNFGSAPAAALGNNTASATCYGAYVGPSHGRARFQSDTPTRTIGIKNLGGSTAALIINGWRGAKLGGP